MKLNRKNLLQIREKGITADEKIYSLCNFPSPFTDAILCFIEIDYLRLMIGINW